MSEPQDTLSKLETVRAETLRVLQSLGQEELDCCPSGESEWSLGEVFMHLAMDEIYLRELIARPLLEGVKPPDAVGFLPPPPQYGEPKELILFWFHRAREGTRRLFASWPAHANLTLTHEGGLGAMNGLQWLEGYAGKEAYFHLQIGDLMAQNRATE